MRAIRFLVMASVVMTASSAAAEDKQKAKEFFDQAQAAEGEERYRDAAELYLEAYDNFAEPEFLFNAGEAYRLAEDAENAVKYYREYLKLDPEGRGAADAQVAIEKLEPLIEPKEPTVVRPVGDPPPPKKVEPKPDPTPQPPPPIEPPAETPTDRGRPLRLAGIATAATGGVLLGIGIYSGLQARSISNELSDVQVWLPQHDAKFDEGENAETRMFIFGAIGVAAAVTGGVLYVAGLKRKDAEEPPVSVSPAFATKSASVIVQGRF